MSMNLSNFSQKYASALFKALILSLSFSLSAMEVGLPQNPALLTVTFKNASNVWRKFEQRDFIELDSLRRSFQDGKSVELEEVLPDELDSVVLLSRSMAPIRETFLRATFAEPDQENRNRAQSIEHAINDLIVRCNAQKIAKIRDAAEACGASSVVMTILCVAYEMRAACEKHAVQPSESIIKNYTTKKLASAALYAAADSLGAHYAQCVIPKKLTDDVVIHEVQKSSVICEPIFSAVTDPNLVECFFPRWFLKLAAERQFAQLSSFNASRNYSGNTIADLSGLFDSSQALAGLEDLLKARGYKCSEITELNLSDNNLTHCPIAELRLFLPKLRTLNLNNNKIVKLSPNEVLAMKGLYITFKNNPLAHVEMPVFGSLKVSGLLNTIVDVRGTPLAQNPSECAKLEWGGIVWRGLNTGVSMAERVAAMGYHALISGIPLVGSSWASNYFQSAQLPAVGIGGALFEGASLYASHCIWGSQVATTAFRFPYDFVQGFRQSITHDHSYRTDFNDATNTILPLSFYGARVATKYVWERYPQLRSIPYTALLGITSLGSLLVHDYHRDFIPNSPYWKAERLWDMAHNVFKKPSFTRESFVYIAGIGAVLITAKAVLPMLKARLAQRKVSVIKQ